jgi:hypothetical protein
MQSAFLDVRVTTPGSRMDFYFTDIYIYITIFQKYAPRLKISKTIPQSTYDTAVEGATVFQPPYDAPIVNSLFSKKS